MEYMPGADTAEDVVDFKSGQLGKHLGDAKPLLHHEVHRFLDQRKEKQQQWCLDLQRWGVNKGQADSYHNWEQQHAPGMIKCWEYTGGGENGVGQGGVGATSEKVMNDWRYLVKLLQQQELRLEAGWQARHAAAVPAMAAQDLAPEEAYLTPVEIVQLGNLVPGDAEEAKTIIPSLNRFEDESLNTVVTRIMETNDAALGG
eukprot:TRINITY_DN24813_c0_g1_i1.p1 TRINITY_DN24813_c0_g1~~TRINITY_DN24813_c0_g1_i1.p1  ORF type:complete len:201 (+),score=91.62 TRINITY_DN24813_c0_g1_i1:42-644(+)